MIIGGYDIYVSCPLQSIWKAVRELWPSGYVESSEGPIQLNIENAQSGEVFFYRDIAAYHSWTNYGARDDNADQMIHLLWNSKNITLVVNSPNHAVLKTLALQTPS